MRACMVRRAARGGLQIVSENTNVRRQVAHIREVSFVCLHMTDSFVSTSLPSSTPSRARPIADDDSESEAADLLTSLSLGGVGGLRGPSHTPMKPFIPVPMRHTAASSSVRTPAQRVPKEAGPSFGRLGDLHSTTGTGTGSRSTLFPTAAADEEAVVTPPALDASVLHHGLAQILATKDSAKRYIELMRKKMYQYIVLNKEYANTHASEQIRQRGIATLKKTLTARIEQMELLQKTIRRQVSQQESAAGSRLEAAQREIHTLQDANDELTQAHRNAIREAQEYKQEQERVLARLREEGDARLDDARRESHAAGVKLQSALSQSSEEKANLQQQLERAADEINQLKLDLRLQAASATSSSDAAATASSENVHRLEIALEHACNEMDRLQAECEQQKATIGEATSDIQKLIDSHGRIQRAYTRLQTAHEAQSEEMHTVTIASRRAQIELDEARDISAAYQRAYDTTISDKSTLERALKQLIDDFGVLRDHLCALMIEQSGTIPLPMEVIESNPEIGIMLAAAVEESSKEETAPAFPSGELPAVSTPPLSPSRRLLFSRDTHLTSRESSHPSSLDDEDESLASIDNSFAALNLSHVARRLSLRSGAERSVSSSTATSPLRARTTEERASYTPASLRSVFSTPTSTTGASGPSSRSFSSPSSSSLVTHSLGTDSATSRRFLSHAARRRGDTSPDSLASDMSRIDREDITSHRISSLLSGTSGSDVRRSPLSALTRPDDRRRP